VIVSNDTIKDIKYIIVMLINSAMSFQIKPNGTAIGAVCVTGEAIWLMVPVVSKERVPVASRYGAVFAPSRAAGFAIAVYDESL
jgi:hypothetical protein